MYKITGSEFHHSIAESFYHILVDLQDPYHEPSYLFIGRILPWPNEASPNIGNTSINYARELWTNMISAKRVTGEFVRFVLPRVAWTANTKYTQYDDANVAYFAFDDANHTVNNKTYVINSNNDVYKCIDNHANSNSTIQPTGTNNNDGFIKTVDGYTWKYMYHIDTNDNNFLTTDYMPVPEAAPASATVVPGTIDNIIVTNGGFGYNAANNGNNLAIVTITGDGVGAEALANVGGSGIIDNVTMLSYGAGYTWANVNFIGGTGAIARPIISPLAGHGSRPAEELNSRAIMIALKVGAVDASEGNTFTIQNDFRQFGILKGPYKYGTTEYANSNTVMQTTNITVIEDANPAFVIDDYVYQVDASGNTVFNGYIVDTQAYSNTSLVKVTQTRGAVVTGSPLFNKNAVTSKRVSSFENPYMQPFTGRLLYAENILKVQRNNSQAEVFKIVFEF